MGYRTVRYIEQLWYTAKYGVKSFFEWLDAMYFAKRLHPGWLQLATKSRNEELRKYYKSKILVEYRKYCEEVGEWESQE